MKPAAYGPFQFSLIDERPKFTLPGNARVALWVIPNIEFFPLDRAMPGDSNERPKGNDGTPMVRHWAQRDYGNRVGVFRLMDVLAKRNIRSHGGAQFRHLRLPSRDHRRLRRSSAGNSWVTTAPMSDRLNEVPLGEERRTIRHVA